MDDLMDLTQALAAAEATPTGQSAQTVTQQSAQSAPAHNSNTNRRMTYAELLDAIAGLGRAQEGNAAPIEGLIRHARVSSQPGGTVRFHEPRVFNGKATEVIPFLREVNTAIELQQRSLNTERLKVLYMSSFLGDGAPSYWYRSLELSDPQKVIMNDFAKFVSAFKARFEDPDLVAAASRRIQKIEQRGTVADYATRFQDQLVYLDVTDQTSIQWFHKGLSTYQTMNPRTFLKPLLDALSYPRCPI